MLKKQENNISKSTKIIGILQPSYLPWIGFFEQMYQSDIFVFYDDVQFEKGSWRNRNRIKTANGSQWLTVPVMLKGEKFPLIKDVRIQNTKPWQKKQLKSIEQNYSKSPYFEKYFQGLASCIDRPWKKLIDLNLEVITWLTNQLGIKREIRLSSELDISGCSVQRLIDIILALGGTHFYEGAAGQNYIDKELFRMSGICVVYQDYDHPVYPQLYGEFCSHLSIVDLIFNCGPESLNRLLNREVKGKK